MYSILKHLSFFQYAFVQSYQLDRSKPWLVYFSMGLMLALIAISGCHSEMVDGVHAMACGLVGTHHGIQPGLAGLGESRATM